MPKTPSSHARNNQSPKKRYQYTRPSRNTDSLGRSKLPPPSTAPLAPPWYKRITISRQKLGTIVLMTFLFFYLTEYYSVASVVVEDGKENEAPNMPEAVRVSVPKKNYLFTQLENNGNVLPGAVVVDSKKFEIEEEKEKRDLNKLPGAIGVEGAFDENKVSIFGEVADALVAEEVKTDKSKSGKETESDQNPVKEEGKNGKKKGKKKTSKGADGENDTTNKSTLGETEKGNDGSSKEKVNPDEKNDSNSKKSKNKSKLNDDKDKQVIDNRKKSKDIKQEITQSPGPLYTGPHPMNRQMTELQVPGDDEELNEEAVKNHYEKLVKAYMAPFVDGIPRKSFFEILKRRTYSLAPPGSNKGIQTLLFQLVDKSKLKRNSAVTVYLGLVDTCLLIDKVLILYLPLPVPFVPEVYLLDPYDIAKNSKPFYKTRIQELIWLLSDIAKGGAVPDTEFLVAIHDCVQTVNQDHQYRGSIYKEASPTFTIVSCNFSDNIPFPMWEGDPVRGGLKSWDEKMRKYRSMDSTPWDKKESKAVFRGGNRPSMYFKTKKEANDHCDHSGRTAIAYLAKTNPDLFNVGVSGQCGGNTYEMEHLSESGHHAFKYIMYAEGNCFWADRLNKQVFGPSAIIKQETPCGQFWEPLLKPLTHYIPTDFFFSDTVDQIKWAKENDDKVKEIVNKANEFATAFLSVKGIKTYVEVLLVEYTKLLKTTTIKPEKGSADVTT